MINFSEYRTGNKAIDWIIDRVKTFDYSNEHGAYFIGEFKGNIPYRMRDELIKYASAKAGSVTTSHSETLVASDTMSVTFNFRFGQYKSNATRIEFYISYCAE